MCMYMCVYAHMHVYVYMHMYASSDTLSTIGIRGAPPLFGSEILRTVYAERGGSESQPC